MHVLQLNFAMPPATYRREELPWYPVAYVADAARLAGNRVTVLQACPETFELERNGVQYHFMAPGDAFTDLARRLDADVIHVHGLEFGDEIRALHAALPSAAIFVQDHANRPPRPWRRGRWRRGLALAGAFSFCSREQARPFEELRLLPQTAGIFEISESSSDFTPGNQDAARGSTGLRGNPCLLWVGHLEPNKDPLTILEGLSRAAPRLPDPQLWCAFLGAPLAEQVNRRVESDAALRGRVHLLGRIEHARIEQYMRAADLFVLGSHREGSGCALMEALACGLPPVVTDIPSFRALTGGEDFGRLWRAGDPQSFCDALVDAFAAGPARLRAAARERFDSTVSFAAIGRRFTTAYQHARAARAAR